MSDTSDSATEQVPYTAILYEAGLMFVGSAKAAAKGMSMILAFVYPLLYALFRPEAADTLELPAMAIMAADAIAALYILALVACVSYAWWGTAKRRAREKQEGAC